MTNSNAAQPDILQAVRAAFVANGSSLGEWCRLNKIDAARAWRALQGKSAGPKALALRARILAESGRKVA